MFQTQYTNRNKIASIIPTGLEPDTRTYPVVYLKPDGSSNEPLAFGGMDDTKINIRAIVIADSQFDIDAIGSLFRDQRQKNVALLEASEMPFNQFGYYRNGQYNYTGVINGKTDADQIFLNDINISRFDRVLENEVRKFNPNVFSTLIDFELSKFRFPRQC